MTRPDTFDVYHQWHTIDLIWTARTVQAIDLTRILHGDEIKAKALAGRSSGRVSDTVFNKLFLHPDGTLGRKPSDRITMLPSIHGVDAFGYLRTVRDEQAGAPDSWGWLLDSRWHGRTGIMSDPVLGMIEAALATEAAEGVVFGDIGNLSIEEIDLVADLLLHKKKIGHFKGIWRNYEEAARLMQRGGVVVQSMFSPALTRLRRMGLPIISAVPVEGCRGWHADLCISANAGDEVLDAAYDYLNWWQSGWAGACLARQGYYTTLRERARALSWSRRNGPTGTRAALPKKSSTIPSAWSASSPATAAKGARIWSACRACASGTPSWTSTPIWCVAGRNSWTGE